MLHPGCVSPETDKKGQQQPLTGLQVVIQQHSGLPTDLAAGKAARLDGESITMAQFQVGDFKEVVSSIPQVSRDVRGVITHVYFVALEQTRSSLRALGGVTAAAAAPAVRASQALQL